MEISRQRRGRERPDVGNARAGEREALPAAEAIDLQDQRGRAVRIFAGAERKPVEGQRMRRIGDDGERRLLRILGQARPGVKADPLGDRRHPRQWRIEP